ncbi:MAG: site-specific DNA-methyltransferase, partial [Oscillospiraceae bacterium]|nr:site-specific DNA-methyltransferase [Oscillospiraceae bacterium]
MILCGDAIERLQEIDAQTVDACVTSPPYYGLRDYNADGQIGLEPTPDEYIARLVDVFREVRRVLRDDGTLWVVIGD